MLCSHGMSFDGDWHLASCGLPVYRYRAFRYSRREAWLRSDVIRALLARAVPCFPAVLYVYRFLSVRLPWWRWVQPSRVSSLTASRSSFDCLASSTGAGTRESAHSQSNWCALNVCCRRGSAGSAHRCGPGRPTRQHLRYCSAADAAMVGRHCVRSNQASCVSVITVAVMWDPLAILRHYL